MITYIKKDIIGYYIQVPEEIDSQHWEGKIGSTYEDFQNGKWVLLSSAQVDFHTQNPSASIQEVLNMQLIPVPVHEITLEETKQNKIKEIEEYDSSDNVNSFIVHITPDTYDENDILTPGITITTWIDPVKRSNYKNSLDSAELLGLEEVHPIFNGMPLAISTQTAKMALAEIQIYADRCYNVTETHKAAIDILNTIQEVKEYNFTTGYPNRPEFYIYQEEAPEPIYTGENNEQEL